VEHNDRVVDNVPVTPRKKKPVDFFVDCPCGKRTIVDAASAGGTTTCACGQIVEIPLLSVLRRQAGLSAYPINPVTVINELVTKGELPAGKSCLRCRRTTKDIFHAVAYCESSVETHPSGDTMQGVADAIALVVDVHGVEVDPGPESEIKGNAVVVPVPVRVCPDCRPRFERKLTLSLLLVAAIVSPIVGWALLFALSAWAALLIPFGGLLWLLRRAIYRQHQSTLRTLFRRVPQYDELLKRYPDAEFARERPLPPLVNAE